MGCLTTIINIQCKPGKRSELNPILLFIVVISILVTTTACGDKKFPGSAKESRATVKLPSGKVEMYGKKNFQIEIPELEVNSYEVTNASFAEFVNKTGYITTAEKTGEGMVFDFRIKDWVLKQGADWKHPLGPKSSIQLKDMHPVVQVSYEDACAYCEWLDMRLPYESEWEYIHQLNAKTSDEKFNKWDGIFPHEDRGEDGFKNTSPVGSFPTGKKGIYDLQGNVWEWCNDLYHENWPEIDTAIITPRYKGPNMIYNVYLDADTVRVIKGGSFLCADNYCKGYQDKKRQSADPKQGYEHVGFRCVREIGKKE